MKTKLLHELLSMGANIYKVEWPNFVKKDLQAEDFEVRLNNKQKQYLGRGFSIQSSEEALTKALVECFERIVCSESHLENTSGVASHFEAKIARENSEAEYFERLFLLLGFYAGDFKGALVKDHDFHKILRQFDGVKSVTSRVIGIGNTDLNTYCVVASMAKVEIPGRCNGFVIGMGSSHSVKIALRKANIELLQLVGQFTLSNSKSMTLEEFAKRKSVSFYDHGLLALDPTYLQKTETLARHFLSSNEFQPRNVKMRLESLQLKSPFSNPNFNLFTYKSGSSDGLDLFIGCPTHKFEFALRSLMSKLGIPVKEEFICLPHPLA